MIPKLYIIIFIFWSFSPTLKSQKLNICGQVNYVQVKNIAAPVVDDYEMIFNNSQSFYKEVNIEKSKDSKKNESTANGFSEVTEVGRKNLTPRYYFFDNSDFYFRDIFLDEEMVVIEEPNDWNWEIHNETKKIGQFTTSKATIKFRGRDYTAWFTEEIPVPYGPWKFRGLPGLILEVYDTENVFHITTTKVKVGKDVKCTIEIEENDLGNALTLAIYLNKKEKLVDDLFAEMSSQMPKGTPPLKVDKDCKTCSERLEIFNE